MSSGKLHLKTPLVNTDQRTNFKFLFSLFTAALTEKYTENRITKCTTANIAVKITMTIGSNAIREFAIYVIEYAKYVVLSCCHFTDNSHS